MTETPTASHPPSSQLAQERDPNSPETSQPPPPVPPKDGDRELTLAPRDANPAKILGPDKDPVQVQTTQTSPPVEPKDGRAF